MKRCSICGGPLVGHQTKACARPECTRAMERETRRRWLLAHAQPSIPTRCLPDDIYASLQGWTGLALLTMWIAYLDKDHEWLDTTGREWAQLIDAADYRVGDPARGGG